MSTPKEILQYRVVTAMGDQYLCAEEPVYGEKARVDLVGYHVTSSGWHGNKPKRITLPAAIVRYVEHGVWEALGPLPRFHIPAVP